MAWYENLGDSTFGEARVVDDRLALASSIFAEDIDRDGDPDLVAASSLDGVVVYYENGGGVFGEGFVAAAHDQGANDAILCDYDNDGDADLVVGFTNAIFFAENETPAPDPNTDNPNESEPNADNPNESEPDANANNPDKNDANANNPDKDDARIKRKRGGGDERRDAARERFDRRGRGIRKGRVGGTPRYGWTRLARSGSGRNSLSQ